MALRFLKSRRFTVALKGTKMIRILTAILTSTILAFVIPTICGAADKPNVIVIFIDDKCDRPGKMAAKASEYKGKLASRPHLQITENCRAFS
jgi:hypothetical protein